MSKAADTAVQGQPTLSRKWIWKDDSNTLESISLVPGGSDKTAHVSSTKNRRALKVGSYEGTKKNERGTPSVMSKSYGMTTSSQRGQAQLMAQRAANLKGSSPRPSIKNQNVENAVITLDDVKRVAHDCLLEYEGDEYDQALIACYGSSEFDELLLATLNYFQAFFDRLAIENKPKPMVVEPSIAEKKALAMAIKKQEAAQKVLGQSYSVVVLGLGLEQKHHMTCGKGRYSKTYKDREMYEALYKFCSYVTWVTFKRVHNYELILQELGRMFRSDTFNPAGRPKEVEEVLAMDRLKDSSKKPLTPAEYRRIKPRRPAIKSIMNQRSPMIVSLLPTSTEAAPWLVDRKKALPVQSDDIPSTEEPPVNFHMTVRVGVIGEPMSGYNPISLLPFGEEQNEEEEEEEGQEKTSREGTFESEGEVNEVQGGATDETVTEMTEEAS